MRGEVIGRMAEKQQPFVVQKDNEELLLIEKIAEFVGDLRDIPAFDRERIG